MVRPRHRCNSCRTAKQRHIEFEACAEHGVFMDAGEFVDYTNETVMDIFRGVAARFRNK